MKGRAPFGAAAMRTFSNLTPQQQALMLRLLAGISRPRVRPSSLYATDEQREAARLDHAANKARRAKDEAEAAERNAIREKLHELTSRGTWTPTKERRRQALYARLNEMDGIGR